MKTINVTFDDKEYKLLTKRKGLLSWHDYILINSSSGEEVNTPEDKDKDYCANDGLSPRQESSGDLSLKEKKV